MKNKLHKIMAVLGYFCLSSASFAYSFRTHNGDIIDVRDAASAKTMADDIFVYYVATNNLEQAAQTYTDACIACLNEVGGRVVQSWGLPGCYGIISNYIDSHEGNDWIRLERVLLPTFKRFLRDVKPTLNLIYGGGNNNGDRPIVRDGRIRVGDLLGNHQLRRRR